MFKVEKGCKKHSYHRGPASARAICLRSDDGSADCQFGVINQSNNKCLYHSISVIQASRACHAFVAQCDRACFFYFTREYFIRARRLCGAVLFQQPIPWNPFPPSSANLFQRLPSIAQDSISNPMQKFHKKANVA